MKPHLEKQLSYYQTSIMLTSLDYEHLLRIYSGKIHEIAAFVEDAERIEFLLKFHVHIPASLSNSFSL